MTDRWKEIEKLYHSALKHEPNGRVEFLKEACAGDEALRQEVESLLALHVEAEDFIEEPALKVAAKGMARDTSHSLLGQQLGPYKIVSMLGSGGMGEVYRASDSRLGREVAIKVLPSEFSADADRIGRFKQEARAAGQLNHPNILAIYDVSTHEGSPYLVSELLEGETLRDRLHRQEPSQRKALEYAGQIARGLAAAHEKGIVHRDLKPENLFITRSDGVKILDFGLAKLTQRKLDASQLTTATTNPVATEPGVVMGTVGYMSPEQVRGEVADHRSDIFAFGAILYQMLSGKRAFQGNSTVETMHAILNQEPPALSEINGSISPALERIVRHCLEKRPEERYQSARDIAFNLEALSGLSDSKAAPLTVAARRSKSRERLAWGVAALLLLAALPFVVAYLRRPPAETRTLRLFVLPPEKATLGSSAISPDGRQLAFVAMVDGKTFLWVRPLDSLAARALAGTEGANYLFWSPDSRFIGFFTQDKLKKIEASGGPVQTLSEGVDGRGGTWNRKGVIVFAPQFLGALYRIPAAGGAATPVTTLDGSHQENSHRWPHFLPDGRHFLYFVRSAQRDSQGIYLGSLDSNDKSRLLSASGSVAYVPPGYLLFVRDGTLVAQPFDAKHLQTTGDPFSVAEQVGYDPNFSSDFSVSDNGVLTFQRGGSKNTQLVWFDRGGKPLDSIAAPADYKGPQLSPDGKRVAGDRIDPETGAGDIWLLELSRGITSPSRFTFDPSYEYIPIWSPDGKSIVFASNQDGPMDLYQKPLSGTGQSEVLLKSSTPKGPEDWSLDGRFILYNNLDPKTNKLDLWVLPLFGDRQPMPFLQTQFDELQGQFSPNGRWVAYVSDESGRYEVYVQSFPRLGDKSLISAHGGTQPRWRRDGKELYYLAADRKLMAVEVEGNSTFEAGVPKALFAPLPLQPGLHLMNNYDVTADGQRFLFSTLVKDVASEPIVVILNWTAELRR